MDYSFSFVDDKFHPSRSIFSQLKIQFEFFFKSGYYVLNQDSTTPQFLEHFPPSDDPSIYAGVIVGASLSYHDIREAVGQAIGDRLPGEKREELIELACAEVRKRFPTETLPEYELVNLSFDVRIVHRHVPVVESDMVPAVESSLALLEKYEVGRIKAAEEEDRCCCICLEEFVGGGAVRMPCLHVFHGECVKKWLRKSHYCPLCRYEMPTEQSWAAGRSSLGSGCGFPR